MYSWTLHYLFSTRTKDYLCVFYYSYYWCFNVVVHMNNSSNLKMKWYFFSLTGFTHTHTNKFNIFELFFAVTLITLFLWLCNLSIYSMHALCSIAFNNTKLACLLEHEQPAAKTHKNSSSSVLSLMQAAAAGWLYYTLDDPPSMPDPHSWP